MLFPEILYVPAVSDIAKSQVLAQRFSKYDLVSSAATFISRTTPNLAPDQALIVAQVNISSAAGGGQLTLVAECTVLNELGNTIQRIYRADPNVQIHNASHTPTGVVIMPGERLQWACTYDAAAFANTFRASIWGWLVPRANIQLAGV